MNPSNTDYNGRDSPQPSEKNPSGGFAGPNFNALTDGSLGLLPATEQERNVAGSHFIRIFLGNGSSELVPLFVGSAISSIGHDQLRCMEISSMLVDRGMSDVRISADQVQKIMRKLEPSFVSNIEPCLDQNSALCVVDDDTFTMARKALGIDQTDEELEKVILKHASFERGFLMIQEAFDKKFGYVSASMKEINGHLPDLTAMEIFLVSTLQRVPSFLLCTQDEISHIAERTKFPVVCPMCTEITTKGLEFSFCPPSASDPHAEHDTMSFYHLSDLRQFVCFRPEFQQAFEGLILLDLKDSHIYQKIHTLYAQSCSIAGYGRIVEQILSRLVEYDQQSPAVIRMNEFLKKYNISPEDIRSQGLTPLLKKRNIPTSQLFERANELIAQTFVGVSVKDLSRDVNLHGDMQMMYDLVGLLERAPESFIGPGPFRGYISSFGKGVKIFDENGTLVEYVPYSPIIQWDSQIMMHDIVSDVRPNDFSAQMVFRRFILHARQHLLETEAPLTQLDQTLLYFLARYRVSFATDTVVNQVCKSISGEVVKYDVKLSIGELEEIGRMLELLKTISPELIIKIKKIVKESESGVDFESLKNGVVHYADIDKFGTITIYNPASYLLRHMGPPGVQTFRDILIHEAGHLIWDRLSEQDLAEFTSISWMTPVKKKELSSHFLTWYSRSEPVEDFCEHFSAYINHYSEFQEIVTKNPLSPLASKFFFIDNVLLKQYHASDGMKSYLENLPSFTIFAQSHESLSFATITHSSEEAYGRLVAMEDELEKKKVEFSVDADGITRTTQIAPALNEDSDESTTQEDLTEILTKILEAALNNRQMQSLDPNEIEEVALLRLSEPPDAILYLDDMFQDIDIGHVDAVDIFREFDESLSMLNQPTISEQILWLPIAESAQRLAQVTFINPTTAHRHPSERWDISFGEYSFFQQENDFAGNLESNWPALKKLNIHSLRFNIDSISAEQATRFLLVLRGAHGDLSDKFVNGVSVNLGGNLYVKKEEREVVMYQDFSDSPRG